MPLLRKSGIDNNSPSSCCFICATTARCFRSAMVQDARTAVCRATNSRVGVAMKASTVMSPYVVWSRFDALKFCKPRATERDEMRNAANRPPQTSSRSGRFLARRISALPCDSRPKLANGRNPPTIGTIPAFLESAKCWACTML